MELELGLSWVTFEERLRISAGYLLNIWFNTMTTPTWINAVQQQNFTSVDETLSIDGLSIRGEWRF